MQKGTYVYCTTQFEGFHCWPEAPDEVKFLRDNHRHIFHVKVTVKVTHNNRDVEFIHLKHRLDKKYSGGASYHELGSQSCEMIAEEIQDWMEIYDDIEVHSVEVSEDGENGAILVC